MEEHRQHQDQWQRHQEVNGATREELTTVETAINSGVVVDEVQPWVISGDAIVTEDIIRVHLKLNIANHDGEEPPLSWEKTLNLEQ